MLAMFDYRYKLPLHCVELFLIVAVIAISGARLTLPGLTRTRANTIALSFSAKSIAFIGYQVVTEHVAQFRRWKSLKAYAIINGLEIVFWGAVVFLLIQANVARCIGTGCTLSWVVVSISIVMSMLSSYAFLICFIAFRESRKEQTYVSESQEHAMSQRRPVAPEAWSGSSTSESLRK